MTIRFSLKIDPQENRMKFVILDEKNEASVEMLMEQFSLVMLAKKINRESDANEKIKTFLAVRNDLSKQIVSYKNIIEMIYDGPIRETYVMSDLCHYLINHCGLSEFLDQGTSETPNRDHEILFIGDIKPKINTVIVFN